MTPQEQQLIDDFLQRLAAVTGVNKDAQADALIQQRLAGQPDALYLLVQRCLLQQHALDAAKAQIAQLQTQAAGQQGGASFLGGQPQAAWGANPPPYPPQQAAPMHAPTWRERLFGSSAPAAPQQGGGSSFFANAATTAAGVAGGMFLFDGIESLLGGHHGGGLFGGGFGGGQPEIIENVTENNFFDQGGNNLPSGGDQDFASNDFDDSNFDSSGFDDDSSWT